MSTVKMPLNVSNKPQNRPLRVTNNSGSSCRTLAEIAEAVEQYDGDN
jgi:hypothetical protein